MSIANSLRERLESHISDPIEFANAIVKAIIELAEILDNDIGVTRTDIAESLNDE